MKQSRMLDGAARTLSALSAFAALLAVAPAASAATAEPPIPRGEMFHSWRDNGAGGNYVLQLVQGHPLSRGATLHGVVTSDLTCTPDEQGYSHCHNGVDLADGTNITVVDNHAMNIHPCLKPGEQIVVSGLNSTWVKGVVADRQ